MKKNLVNKVIAGIVVTTMTFAMAGCGSFSTSGTSASDASSESTGSSDESASAVSGASADEENYDTGDASLDDPRNGDDIGEKELLVVSFGTSYNDSRRETIGAIEGAMEDAFPDYSVRRGFTSNIIIDHIESRDGETIDDVKEALDRAVDNGVKTLVVQPTHLMNGHEYTDLSDAVSEYADSFDQIAMGQPLLSSDEDYEKVITAITDATSEYDDGKTAIVFMGHGTSADSNEDYTAMQNKLTADGYENYYITTVEATPTTADVIEEIKDKGYTKVVLRPLMVVAGDHANNDMAGEDSDSIKSQFEAAGYEVTCIVEGLGQLTAIQDLYVAHAQAAIDSLK